MLRLPKATRPQRLRHLSLRRSVVTLGIRQEDPTRIWERRSPLTPDAVETLVREDGVEVLVQPCAKRVFPMQSFIKAGAKAHPTLEPANIILGIKEPPIPSLSPILSPTPDGKRRTHLMFSHTHKGQAYNLPLLSTLLSGGSSGPRVIDYELMTESEGGKRVAGFGWFAGVSGTIEGLVASALDHLQRGIASPFLHLPRPFSSPNLAALHASLALIKESIEKYGTPKDVGPFVIGVTGTGNVANGVMDTLKHLPVQWVNVEQLADIVGNPATDLTKIYAVHATLDTYLTSNAKPYSRQDYYAHPELYKSLFHEKIAPYLTLLLNGVSWSPSFPRMMSNDQLRSYLSIIEGSAMYRKMTIADITCDITGGLEFVDRSTTIDAPTFRTPRDLGDMQIMAVDILPTELPLEASGHFSEAIMPYVRSLVREYNGIDIGDNGATLKDVLARATTAEGGALAEKHAWLGKLLDAESSKSKGSPSRGYGKKRVLLLGSGLVSRPFVDEVCKCGDTVEVIVASNVLSEAEALVSRHSNAQALFLDASDGAKLKNLIQDSDVVVSLLPPPFHPTIARHCIESGKDMVTASYISEEMRGLDSAAKDKGVILLSEIGLDPGLDHCTAMSLLSRVRAAGLEPVSFTSFCGGIPSPEDIPAQFPQIGYKFSWSPLGVLRAALNPATFILRNENQHITGERLLVENFGELKFEGTPLRLEGIANRDSLPYREEYGLSGDSVRSVVRGTLRYPGFSELLQGFKRMGLLNGDIKFGLDTWTDLVRLALGRGDDSVIRKGDETSFLAALRDQLQISVSGELWEGMGWLGLHPFSPTTGSDKDLPALSTKPLSAIEHFSRLLSHKLRYNPGERDMVILAHEVVARARGSQSEEVFTSSLLTSGSPMTGESAMSLTVGLPLAFATLEVLDGKIDKSRRGVLSGKEVWEPVLQGMDRVGIVMQETRRKLDSTSSRTVESQLVNVRAPTV